MKYSILLQNTLIKSHLLGRYPKAIDNIDLIENFSLDSKMDLNKLININNIYFNLEKIHPNDKTCADFSKNQLRETFNISHYKSNVINEINVLINCGCANWAFLCDLSPKFKEQEISKHIRMINITKASDYLKVGVKKVDTYVDPDLMEVWIRKKGISWDTLSFKEVDHVLNTPYLGILEDQLLDYFITRDLSILTRCIENVKKNPEPFIFQKNTDLSPTKIKFEWHGKSTISTCKSPAHINYKKVNIQGLRVLRNACIFEIKRAREDQIKSKELYLINQIQDSIIWNHLCYLIFEQTIEDVIKGLQNTPKI